MLSRKQNIPEDLRGIDAALRDSRPELPADRLASVAARARSRARASVLAHVTTKESFLRSRIAITLMLVLGFGFSSAGVGMAVQGVATQDTSAADAQYGLGQPDEQPTLGNQPDQNEVADEVDEGTEVGGQNEEAAGNEVAGEQQAQPTQETRQLGAEEGGEELPFTGFAAIPVLLMGLALLSAGFVLRRRA